MTSALPNSLTIAALARRESDHLEACFRSVQPMLELTGATKLIVLDADTDALTEEVARRVADRVHVAEFVNFSIQRNRALALAETEWLFFIDADERATPLLAREVADTVRKASHDAYRVPRRNILFGREVRHTGWWPDYQVRLLRVARCRYDETREVHELPAVQGSIGTLSAPLIHFNYKTWGQFVEKQRAYAALEARALHRQGKTARLRGFLGQPVRELRSRFIDYEGYKDGLLGVALSLAMALYKLETHRQLYLLQHRSKD